MKAPLKRNGAVAVRFDNIDNAIAGWQGSIQESPFDIVVARVSRWVAYSQHEAHHGRSAQRLRVSKYTTLPKISNQGGRSGDRSGTLA